MDRAALKYASMGHFSCGSSLAGDGVEERRRSERRRYIKSFLHLCTRNYLSELDIRENKLNFN